MKINEGYPLKGKIMKADKNQVFEGVIVAAGWDKLEHINQSSLYTEDDEDILLKHYMGISKFAPYLNQKVKVWGDVFSLNQKDRILTVSKIQRL